MISAKKENFYEETRKVLVEDVESSSKALEEYGMKPLKWEGSYYLSVDISDFREKIPKEYYQVRGSPEKTTPSLDKAFCRYLVKNHSIGFLPLSSFYLGEKYPDFIVRISMNRNKDEIKYMLDCMKETFKALISC